MNSKMKDYYSHNNNSAAKKLSYKIMYEENSTHAAIKFIFECSVKLELRTQTTATAAVLLHRVYRNLEKPDYDKFAVATSCIYLAGKICDDPAKLRDIINVSQVTLDKEEAMAELDNEHWINTIRDTIVQCEMFIMRVLHFDVVNSVMPHIYLLNYIKTLEGWFSAKTISKIPITKCALSLLTDFYHNPNILNYKESHIAISCLVLALQIYGLNVPCLDESESSDNWFKDLVPDIGMDKVWEIIEQVLKVYDFEINLEDTRPY